MLKYLLNSSQVLCRSTDTEYDQVLQPQRYRATQVDKERK